MYAGMQASIICRKETSIYLQAIVKASTQEKPSWTLLSFCTYFEVYIGVFTVLLHEPVYVAHLLVVYYLYIIVFCIFLEAFFSPVVYCCPITDTPNASVFHLPPIRAAIKLTAAATFAATWHSPNRIVDFQLFSVPNQANSSVGKESIKLCQIQRHYEATISHNSEFSSHHNKSTGTRTNNYPAAEEGHTQEQANNHNE